MPKPLKVKVGDTAPDFTITDARGEEVKLSSYRGSKQVVLVFLRYAGCPICQLALQDLKAAYGDFSARGAEVIAFVQSPAERVRDAAYEFPFKLIPDPTGRTYETYGIGSGSPVSLLGPKTVRAAIKATMKGHFQGKMEGNQWQLPGDFVVDTNGIVRLAHIGSDLGDNLSPEELLKGVSI